MYMICTFQVLFWLSFLTVIYVYFGYPMLLTILSRSKSDQEVQGNTNALSVSIVIAAYNEEKVIARKIENSLGLDYPEEKLEIIVASDGSTDRTNEIVGTFAETGVSLVALESNRGKSSVQNRAVADANGEIILFTDANVMLRRDAIQKLVRGFCSNNVGCVVGKVTYLNENETSVSQGEGVYWRYELFLRKKESEFGNLAIGSGPIMAVRSELFEPLDSNVGEDFVLPMQVAMNGYRVIYEPEAVSEEILFQNTPKSMFRTKVRVISKDLYGLFLCRGILNPFRQPAYAWSLASHKLLRWLVPYFLITLVCINLVLLGNTFYNIVLLLQLIFYLLAMTGYLWQRNGRPPRIMGIPFSFCLVNVASLVGVARFILGKKAGKWTPVR